jgi:hypothetical protein
MLSFNDNISYFDALLINIDANEYLLLIWLINCKSIITFNLIRSTDLILN